MDVWNDPAYKQARHAPCKLRRACAVTGSVAEKFRCSGWRLKRDEYRPVWWEISEDLLMNQWTMSPFSLTSRESVDRVHIFIGGSWIGGPCPHFHWLLVNRWTAITLASTFALTLSIFACALKVIHKRHQSVIYHSSSLIHQPLYMRRIKYVVGYKTSNVWLLSFILRYCPVAYVPLFSFRVYMHAGAHVNEEHVRVRDCYIYIYNY